VGEGFLVLCFNEIEYRKYKAMVEGKRKGSSET